MEGAADTKLGSKNFVRRVCGNFDHEIYKCVFTSNSDCPWGVDTSDPKAIFYPSVSEDLFDHGLSFLHADAQCNHPTVSFSLCHGGGTSDCNADSSLSVVMSRSVAHGNFTDATKLIENQKKKG